MTDDEIKAHIGRVEAEAKSLAMKEANRGRNQAMSVFAFVALLLGIVGWSGLDVMTKKHVDDLMKQNVVAQYREAAQEASDDAVEAAKKASHFARLAEKHHDMVQDLMEVIDTIPQLKQVPSLLREECDLLYLVFSRVSELKNGKQEWIHPFNDINDRMEKLKKDAKSQLGDAHVTPGGTKP